MAVGKIILNRNSITHIEYRGLIEEYMKSCANNHKRLGGYHPSSSPSSVNRMNNVHNQFKRNVRAINQSVRNNFLPETSIFVTLTFSDTEQADINKLSICNKLFSAFIQKLNRSYSEFIYVAVAGLQSDRQTVHYHMLCNLQQDSATTLNNLWIHGNVHIREVDNLKHCSAYLAKNIKDIFSFYSFQNMPSYYRVVLKSKRLNKPIELKQVIKEEESDYFTATNIISNSKAIFTKSYEKENLLAMDVSVHPFDCTPLFPIVKAGVKK